MFKDFPSLGISTSASLVILAAVVGCGGSSDVAEAGTAGGGTGGDSATGGGTTSGGTSGSAATTSTSCVATEVEGTQVVYDIEAAQAATPNDYNFFAFPWPEISRPVTELANVPNPPSATGCTATTSNALTTLLLAAIEPVVYRDYVAQLASRFLTEGPNQAQVILHFNGAIDEGNLPTPEGSLDAQSSPVLLVDLEAEPTRGRLTPVLTRVLNDSRYAESNTLSILPHPGFPLAPSHLYAAVVRRSLGDTSGASLGSPAAFEAKKLTGNCAMDSTYAAAFDLLETQFSLARTDIAMMTVFRSGNPTQQFVSRLNDVDAVASPTTLANVGNLSVVLDDPNGYYVVSGTFNTLVVQEGTPPYLPQIGVTSLLPTVNLDPESTNGRLLTHALPTIAGGTDVTAPRTEQLNFKLMVPVSVTTGSPAAATLPVVIYGPGTGGSIDSAGSSGIAANLAAQGIATFATTPVMHQERAHADNIDSALLAYVTAYGYDDDLVGFVESGDLFFNSLDLQAAKGNSLQAALDYAWQAKILSELSLSTTLGTTNITLDFEPRRIGFLGHSQGAATGPLLATSQQVVSQVLSAPAGHLSTNLLGKTKPTDTVTVSNLLDYLVCESTAEVVDIHHPFLNLLLHWFEDVDAANYAPLFTFEAPSTPKHLFVLAGTEDHYVAPESHQAVTTAARLQHLSASLAAVAGQELLSTVVPDGGHGTTYESLSGNLTIGTTSVTGAFRQYHGDVATCGDDHFVYTCTTQGQSDWLRFFTTLETGTPTVP